MPCVINNGRSCLLDTRLERDKLDDYYLFTFFYLYKALGSGRKKRIKYRQMYQFFLLKLFPFKNYVPVTCFTSFLLKLSVLEKKLCVVRTSVLYKYDSQIFFIKSVGSVFDNYFKR